MGGPRLVLLGRPGAGKGTQASLLSEIYGVVHISTGDMLRDPSGSVAALGSEARAAIDAGELLADDLVIALVAGRMAQDDVVERGFVLDGFPRTPAQADALAAMLAPETVDVAIDLEVAPEVVQSRLVGRRLAAGEASRRDDAEEVVERRLARYEAEAAAVAEWFARRGLLVVVDGLGTTEEVTARLRAVVDATIAAG